MKNYLAYIIAVVLLGIMFFLGFSSMKDISATFDETAHISAGFSYLTQNDYRSNPEHPPLIKDLSALPLLFLNLNFPESSDAWTKLNPARWWDQFNLGFEFLYRQGNNPEEILFFSRLPMLFVLMLLGLALFLWTRKKFGNNVSILSLFFFSFSPTFLAHGRLVTTDVGAGLGIFLSTIFFLKFLKNPNLKNIILTGITLGIALLIKFSTILLFPFFIIITLVFVILYSKNLQQLLKKLAKYTLLLVIIGLVSLFLIWFVYQFHISSYDQVRQTNDIKEVLSSNPSPSLVNINVWMSQNKTLRPIAQYVLGIMMATQRVGGGNTTYFLGEISAKGVWYYFPVIYFFKIPLAFHILTLIAILFLISSIKLTSFQNFLSSLKNWLKAHFIEFSMLVFLAIYWLTSITGNLNIGVRHILPTFPFIYILVSLGIENSFSIIKTSSLKKTAIFSTILLISWYAGSSLIAFPHYLSYFNETAGNSTNGHKIAVDSNYDWGQDLKRLGNFVKNPPTGKEIEKIYIDYFGGGDLDYYLGEKYEKWQSTNLGKDFPKNNYLAVSISLLQGGMAKPAIGFDGSSEYYNWLNNYQPIARAGNSIFIYYIKD